VPLKIVTSVNVKRHTSKRENVKKVKKESVY